MNKKPLLSVAIATKNREKYCIEAIKSILNYQDNEIEITVADNSETSLVKEFVEKCNSSQIKYRYDSGPVSSIENFNRAIELTTGEYVMLIGDDDSILPKALQIAKWAKDNSVDSVCSKENLIYYWPGVLDKFPDGGIVLPHSTDEIQKIDIRKNLESLIKNGLQMYLLFPLPKTYHGIVKKSLMEEIKERTGHYYGGLSPDLYSSVAVSCVAKNHYVINEPLSIAGVCAVSTTADNFKGAHSGTLDNIPHLKHREGYQFSKMIPLYYSVNTIWAESGLKALEELKEVELLKKFNLYYLMAQGWVHNRKFIPEVISKANQQLLIEHKISPINYFFGFGKSLTQIFGKKALQIIKDKVSQQKTVQVKGFNNLQEVINFVKENKS